MLQFYYKETLFKNFVQSIIQVLKQVQIVTYVRLLIIQNLCGVLYCILNN